MPHSASRFPTGMLGLIAAAAMLAHGGSGIAAPLKVCIDETSPAAGADARVAAAVAQAQGTTLGVYRYKGLPKGDDDDFGLHNYKALLAEQCELVIGFPHAPSGDLPGFLKATRPYATTGFVLVTAANSAATSLESLPKDSHVAVAYNTLPNFYFRHHPNLVRDIVESETDALEEVSHGRVAGAMLWRASVVHHLEGIHALGRFRLQALDEPNSQYGLVALYRKDNDEAAQRFEAAIDSLRASGALASALGSYAEAQSAPVAAAPASESGHQASGPRMSHVRSARTCAKGKGKPLEALYAEPQAAAGKDLFAEKCALCHGPLLEGRAGPALKGKFFLSEQGKHTLGDIFTIVSQNMPATLPGTLPHDDYVKIMAYLLQQNGYPAGTSELTFDGAKKSKTQLRDHSS